MKTVEQVAREAAESLVRLSGPTKSAGVTVMVGGVGTTWLAPEVRLERLRAAIAKAIAEAIEDALRLCPVPAGLDDEGLSRRLRRLGELSPLTASEPPPSGGPWEPGRRYSVWRECYLIARDLAGHIDHLHRIMADPMDRLALDEAYRRGLADGARPLTLLDPDEALAKTPPGED